MAQIHGPGKTPLLFSDRAGSTPGPGPAGNPLAVVIRQGRCACANGMEAFRILKLDRSESRLRAYLEHDSIPLLIGLDISVEDSVIQWLGQALWNGDEKIEAEIHSNA